MLKALAFNCLQGRLHNVTSTFQSNLRHGTETKSPLLRVLSSLRNSNRVNPNLYQRAFFCSDSSDGSDTVVEIKRAEEGEEVDSKSSSAIVPTVFRPEDYLTVLALPLPHRPLFPGFYMPIYVKDPKLLAALVESRKRHAPYAGAFLIKDEPGTDPSLASGSDTEKNIYELKGKELLNRLHEVGTLAQITSIQGDQVVLIGHRRLRITEMVSEDPLTVKVDHLKDKPYNKDDDVIKATSFEVISTLRDVLKTSSLWRDHVQTYTQHIGDFNYPRLADFGAAISGANKLQCQEVLEELDVYKRLKLTLELVKKEMEISKIQESIAKAIEEKISGEQRRYLLNEQLKAIKKELGLEADDKTALSSKFRERLEPNKEKCPPHVLQVIEEELTKLQLLEASSSEFNVTRNYLDWLTALPWGNYSDENFDVIRAQGILDEDHYGLSDVKERILKFIAVGKLRGTSQGKIICFSGPLGVGKTSIGRSIARALNRKFYRFSVGGLSDVAEIKGHRRTYIGAMPGKMVQCLKRVATTNRLVLIDEIGKLGRGHEGDPASAMLELLDPEQSANFLDHYLDVPIDLSKKIVNMENNGDSHRSSVRDRLGPNAARFGPIITRSDPVRRQLFTPTAIPDQDLHRRRTNQQTLVLEDEDRGSSQPGQQDRIRLRMIKEAETELEFLRHRQQEWDAHLTDLRRQRETVAIVVGGEREVTPHSQPRTAHQDDIRRPSRSERCSGDTRQPSSPTQYHPQGRMTQDNERRAGPLDQHYRRRTRSPIDRRHHVHARVEQPQEEQQVIPQATILETILNRLVELEQRPDTVRAELRVVDPKSPFSPAITQERVDPKKKLPPLEMYDGTGDPYDHTHSYQSVMDYYNHLEAGMCRIFVTTLKKSAKQWFMSLPPNCINSWKELCDKFHERFGSNKRRGNLTVSLMQIRQKPGESLSQYVQRFRDAVGTITDLNMIQALGFFTTGLDIGRNKKLMKDVMFNPLKDLSDAYERAERFIAIDEAMRNLKPQTHTPEKPMDRDRSYNSRFETQPKREFNNGSSGIGRPPFPNQNVNKIYTPLNIDRGRILEEIRDKPYFEQCPTSSHPGRGDLTQYCNYHQNVGHSTEECWQLKNLIEKNVQNGNLRMCIDYTDLDKACPNG